MALDSRIITVTYSRFHVEWCVAVADVLIDNDGESKLIDQPGNPQITQFGKYRTLIRSHII